MLPVDENITTVSLMGVIKLDKDDDGSAVISLDDGTDHSITWPGSPLGVGDGDRVEFRVTAIDGIAIAYDVLPEKRS